MIDCDWNLDPTNTDGRAEKDEHGWKVAPPGRRMLCYVTKHEVTEHDDGTITLSPSVGYSTQDRSDYWHGWLEHGVFREG